MDARKFLITILSSLLLQLQVSAQRVTVIPNPKKIQLGEQFELILNLAAAPGSRLEFPQIPDSLNHLEVVKRSRLDSVREGDHISYTLSLTMTGFEPGQWTIPAFGFTVNGKKLRSDSVKINVMTVPLRGKDYNDIKEIKEVEDHSINWIRVLIALAGVLIILVGAYVWWKRKQRPRVPAPVSRSTAYEEAMASLKQLKQEGADQKGEMKLYYSSLYDILRLYLARVSGKAAMQYTTDELLLLTKDMFQPQTFSAVAEVFRISDAVKFARYGSGLTESGTSWERIRQGIDEINKMKK